jgi:hypothetical protein
MDSAKDVQVDHYEVRDTAQLEEWRRNLLISDVEARKDLATRQRRVHRAMISVVLVAAMVAVMSLAIDAAHHPDLIATLGLRVKDIAKIALGSIWFCGGLLTWVATRH